MCQETLLPVLLPTAAALDVVACVSGAGGLPDGLGDARVGAVGVGTAVDVGAWCVKQGQQKNPCWDVSKWKQMVGKVDCNNIITQYPM